MDRFDKVIGDFGADGFFHEEFFFALGDHNDRHQRLDLLEAGQSFQTTQSRHVFVQQNQIKILGRRTLQGLESVVDRGGTVAFAFQKRQMRREQIDFVVSPKN